MQEFSQIIFSKKNFFYQGKMKNILKYSRMLLLFSKWISQNWLIIWQACTEAAAPKPKKVDELQLFIYFKIKKLAPPSSWPSAKKWYKHNYFILFYLYNY